MGIFLGIVFFISVIGAAFLLFTWGLWILGIAMDFFSGVYRLVFRKPRKSSRHKSQIRIRKETDALDYAMCRDTEKYTVTVDIDQPE